MQSATIDRFAGLNLAGDPEEVGAAGAIDGMNFDLDRAGTVRGRNGYAKLSATPATGLAVGSIGYSAALTHLVVSAGTTAVAYSRAGVLLAATADLTYATGSIVPFGSPTAHYVYLPRGNSDTTISRWDGTTWTYPAAGYSAYLAAVKPNDNRLVLANFIGGGGFPSHVRFSNAGAPETFSANDFAILTPGDGEQITAICAWGNSLFIFKETKFFVFGDTGTDSTGQPVFSYRTVNTGVGVNQAALPAGQGACAGPDGVYFFAGDGIYRTSGGTPIKVSGALDPFFVDPAASPFNEQMSPSPSSVYLAAVEKRVYFTCRLRSGTTRRMFVYDTQIGQWMVWDVQANGVSYRRTTAAARPEVVFAYGALLATDIGTFTPGLTTDAGGPISSRYRTGFLDLGVPDSEKYIRELVLDGTGTIDVATAINDAAVPGSQYSVTLGATPAVAQGRDRRSILARNVSIELSSGSGAWSCNRVTANIQSVRQPGIRSVAA